MSDKTSENPYLAHFRSVLKRSPGARKYLERICATINRKGTVPSTLLISTGQSALPSEVLDLFGPAHISLSARGDVRLSLSKLLREFDREQKRIWTEAVFSVCGRKPNPNRSAKSRMELNFDRFRLVYPQFASYIKYSSNSEISSAEKQYSLWCNAARIVQFLETNSEALTLSDLGARLFGDSKLLRSGALINTAAEWLAMSCSENNINLAESDHGERQRIRKKVLREHCVVDNLSGISVTLYGPLEYRKKGITFDHVKKAWECGEASVLTLENLHDIEDMSIAEPVRVITSENESPFCKLVRERTEGILIYTQGFPNAAVCRLYRRISSRYPRSAFLHWGDTDLAGLRIAAILHRLHPLKLWRCDPESVLRHRSGLIPLTNRSQAQQFAISHPDFPFLKELAISIENGWLEQESYVE
ncbi:MAG: Wadjet anti-phage system protein JetD domain-containing protein [Chitinispirillaceae bacterium]